jgi:hypothetical protein
MVTPTPDVVRVAIAVFVVALTVSLAVPHLAARLPAVPVADVALLSVLAPQRFSSSDSVGLFAGVRLPTGRTGVHVRVCSSDTCTTVRRATLEGPADWWGRLAILQLAPGHHEVTVFILRPWGWLGDRTVARHVMEVVVH